MVRVFLALPMAFLLILIGFPVLYNVLMSFQDVTLMTLPQFMRPWIGMGNYTTVLGEKVTYEVLANTFIFVGGNVVFQIAIGLSLALFFEMNFPGAKFMRGLFLVGWMLPPLVIGSVWKWLFATESGAINAILGSNMNWLSDPSTALWAVTTANIWFGTPFSMILLSAAVSNVPKELLEAASLDGAGPIRRFIYITLPAISASLLAVVSLTIIYSMRAFDVIWAMTKGGPVDSSTILPLFSYRLSFDEFKFGDGAAAANLAFIIVFIVALIYVRSIKHEKTV